VRQLVHVAGIGSQARGLDVGWTPCGATIAGVPLNDMETRKDTVQVAVESAFKHVGQIAAIIAAAGRDVTREIGDWATDVFEMRDAARRAREDVGPAEADPTVGPAEADPTVDAV
jgi:hypothetical protein